MPITKDQARRWETETSNPNEAELEQPPQKRRRQSHGYNLFVWVIFNLTWYMLIPIVIETSNIWFPLLVIFVIVYF